jgi:hypothetical protein
MRTVLGLHSGQIVIGAGDEVVPAGWKFKNSDIGGGSQGNGLFQEVLRVAEEPIRSFGHIILIGLWGES